MKKIVSLLLAALLLLLCATAVADVLSFARKYPSFYKIYEQDANGSTFIDMANLFSASDLAFTHRYSSGTGMSLTYNDLYLYTGGSAEPVPIWRLWIYYEGTKPLNITSVTISFKGKNYTFTDLWQSVNETNAAGITSEHVMIKFGMNNYQFLTAAENYKDELIQGESNYMTAIQQKAVITMTLHGTEDVEVQLSGNFLVDMMMIDSLFGNEGRAFEYFGAATDPTPLTITNR